MTDVEMRILLLWDRERLDTWDIANLTRRHEADVCKTLWRLREDRRRDRHSQPLTAKES